MGIALVGTAFILELGRRRNVALSLDRVIAALVGGAVGWGINVGLDLDLIRLVVPKVPAADVSQAAVAALSIGAISGAVTSLTGEAIYWAKGWQATPVVRLVIGGLALLASAVAVAIIATPAASVGPGGNAIVWAETTKTAALTLLAVGLLRAVMTTSAVAAGGCGGVFVPFLAIGDTVGRVFAEAFGLPPGPRWSLGRCRGHRGRVSTSRHGGDGGDRDRRPYQLEADVPGCRRGGHGRGRRIRPRTDATHERRQGAVASPRGAALVAPKRSRAHVGRGTRLRGSHGTALAQAWSRKG